MNELNDLEVAQVSGGRPVGFFCSYILDQNGYNCVSSIGIATALGLACTLSALPFLTTSMFMSALTTNFVTSAAGYCISKLVRNKD